MSKPRTMELRRRQRRKAKLSRLRSLHKTASSKQQREQLVAKMHAVAPHLTDVQLGIEQ